MALLTWEEKVPSTGPSSYRGRRGGVRIFSIHANTNRSEPFYGMYTFLPGFKEKAKWNSDNLEELKETAEGIFGRWLDRTLLAPKEVA